MGPLCLIAEATRQRAVELFVVLGDKAAFRFSTARRRDSARPLSGKDRTACGQRLCQLIEVPEPLIDHTFEIRFLDAGA